MRVTVGDVREPGWRDAMVQALRELGARRVWHTYGPDVELWWYRVGWRVVAIDWDLWSGLSLRGPARLVTPLVEAVRPHVRTDAAPERRATPR